MKKIIKNLLIVLYSIIAIVTTVCLLSYNEHRVTQFGKTSLIIIDNKNLEPVYNKNDLVIVNGADKINVGDKVFFYNTYDNDNKNSVSAAKVIDAQKVTNSEITYTLEGGKEFSSESIIGKSDTAKRISTIGLILKVLESKFGYLFLIVLPSLIAFLYELVEVIKEIKTSKK